jgi:hypothetical protein
MRTVAILDYERHCHVIVMKPENISLFLQSVPASRGISSVPGADGAAEGLGRRVRAGGGQH